MNIQEDYIYCVSLVNRENTLEFNTIFIEKINSGEDENLKKILTSKEEVYCYCYGKDVETVKKDLAIFYKSCLEKQIKSLNTILEEFN